jgi:multimeric flavodoxin WrbA
MRDDMAGIVERIMADDLIVFGSPNYFNNVTGLMKDFMDRLQPLRVEDKLAGKKAVVIMVGEEGDSKSSAAIATMTSAADILKMAKVGDLYLVAKKALDVENNPESVQKIDDFAKNILS